MMRVMMRANALKKVIGAATVAVVMCGVVFTGCGGGGGKSLNSAEALLEYLNKQPANTPDKPIKVSMRVNEQMIPSIRDVINRANKYVSLNLTESPLTEIPDEAFATIESEYEWTDDIPCVNLVEIVIPNGVTRIGDGAFEGCKNLLSINIPSSVTAIGNRAFRDCIGISEITIPRSVTEIEHSAFSGWIREQKINVSFANQEAADAVWGDGWRTVYQGTHWDQRGNKVVRSVPINATINYGRQ